MEKHPKTLIKHKSDEQANQITNTVCRTSVKVSSMWYFVAEYLEMLNSIGAIFDKEFVSRFNGLLDYVYGKINLPVAENIVDEYVVYEVEV